MTDGSDRGLEYHQCEEGTLIQVSASFIEESWAEYQASEAAFEESLFEESWAEYDGQGIYLCRVCPECEEAKMSRYRPEVLSYYTQADVDEPIETEE